MSDNVVTGSFRSVDITTFSDNDLYLLTAAFLRNGWAIHSKTNFATFTALTFVAGVNARHVNTYADLSKKIFQ